MASRRARGGAFAGAALGSLLLASIILVVVSVFSLIEGLSGPKLGRAEQVRQASAVEQRCLQAETQAGLSVARSVASCSGCPTFATMRPGYPSGVVCSSSMPMRRTGSDWALSVLVFGFWAVLVFGAWYVVFRAVPRRVLR